MRTFKVTFAGAFAGAVMACNVASLHAAPLPTNVAAMKSMVTDSSIQVRWGGWGFRGFGGWGPRRGFGWGGGVLAGAIVGGAIASTAYGYYGGPSGYVGYGYYPGYVGYGPYYRSGPWPAMQEPGLARFYYGYGWRPWGY